MKKFIGISVALAVMLGTGLVVGCGGSSAPSATGGSTALDTKSVDKLGKNVAELVPGCVYTSQTVATVPDVQTISAYKMVLDNVIKPTKNSRKVARATPINESETGDCGGTFTEVGTHDNGDDDVVYTFTNYCTQDDANNTTTLNGTVHVVSDGTPTDAGPVVNSVTASTGASGITTATVVEGVTETQTVFANNFKLTMGDPKDTMTATELRVSGSDGEYKVTNLNMEQVTSESGVGDYMKINSATYYDPEVGAVTISTSAIPLDDSAGGAATLSVTGGGGSAVFTATDISTGLFTVTQNGTTIGGLDCSALMAADK